MVFAHPVLIVFIILRTETHKNNLFTKCYRECETTGINNIYLYIVFNQVAPNNYDFIIPLSVQYLWNHIKNPCYEWEIITWLSYGRYKRITTKVEETLRIYQKRIIVANYCYAKLRHEHSWSNIGPEIRPTENGLRYFFPGVRDALINRRHQNFHHILYLFLNCSEKQVT